MENARCREKKTSFRKFPKMGIPLENFCENPSLCIQSTPLDNTIHLSVSHHVLSISAQASSSSRRSSAILSPAACNALSACFLDLRQRRQWESRFQAFLKAFAALRARALHSRRIWSWIATFAWIAWIRGSNLTSVRFMSEWRKVGFTQLGREWRNVFFFSCVLMLRMKMGKFSQDGFRLSYHFISIVTLLPALC